MPGPYPKEFREDVVAVAVAARAASPSNRSPLTSASAKRCCRTGADRRCGLARGKRALWNRAGGSRYGHHRLCRRRLCDRPGVLAVRRLPAGQVRCARLRGDHLYGAGTGTSSRGPLRQSRGPARRPLICAAKCLSQSRLEQGAVVGVVGGGRDSAPRPLARCDHLDGYLRQTEPFRSPPYIPVKDEARQISRSTGAFSRRGDRVRFANAQPLPRSLGR